MALAGAALVWITRQGTVWGALGGLLVSLCAVSGLGVGAIAPLAVFVLGSGALTRLGRERKERMNVAENNLGRRGVSHVMAKLSLPALAGALGTLGEGSRSTLALVYAATLAGAFSDTAATEVGPLARGRAWGVRSFRLVRVPHGSPGGMSATGILAAAGAAVLVALSARFAGLFSDRAMVWVAAAVGCLASVLESLLAGTSLGRRAGHFGRNAFVSIVAAGGALAARTLGWTGW